MADSGVFTIPHGPVRSGVMESMEYLVGTPGENIPDPRPSSRVPKARALDPGEALLEYGLLGWVSALT